MCYGSRNVLVNSQILLPKFKTELRDKGTEMHHNGTKMRYKSPLS